MLFGKYNTVGDFMVSKVKMSVSAFERPDYLGGVQAVAAHLAWGLYAFFAARGCVGGTVAPFGLAICAGVDIKFAPAAIIGAAAGYLFPVAEGSFFIYLAALCAVAAVRMVMSGLLGVDKNPFLNLLIGGLIPLIVFLSVSYKNEAGIISSIEMGLLSGIGAYFAALMCRAVSSGADGLKEDELAAAAVCANILLMSLLPIEAAGISLGRLLMALFLLLASLYGGAQSGGICGIVTAVFLMLYDREFSFAALLYPVGGVAAGLTVRRGKIFSAFSFSACSALFILFTFGDTRTVPMLIESLFAAALFLVIPQTLCVRVAGIFSPPASEELPTGLKGAILMRLRDAAGVLTDVSKTVEKVAGELSRINTPEHADIIAKIEKEACSGCRLKESCWTASRDKTVDSVGQMGASVANSGGVKVVEMPTELRERCIRRERMEACTYAAYYDYLSRLDAEGRIKDVRDVICDQFEGMSYMLRDLSEEFARGERYNAKAAAKLSSALKNIGLRTTECGCRIDKYGRMSLEVRVRTFGGVRINRMRILNVVEAVFEREFEPPVINQNGEDVMIHIGEKPEYSVHTGIAQINCAGATVCGDAYNCFRDSVGRYVMVLSDGMGTGGRAAVDSAMASGLMSQLIKAGFGFDSALKILNSSMLFKSTDESLATVDVTSIDLFTGKTTLYKAGAAPTVVVRSGRIGRAQSSSLPAGILRQTVFDKADISVKAGDLIVMMSDGASFESTDWMSEEIARFDGDVQQLADTLAHRANEMRSDGHADDITVIVAMLQKAV